MSNEWMIDGPRVLDIGEDGERLRRLTVSIVGGRVDVVTHDDSPTARLEVTSVEGEPLRVRWDGAHLRIDQGKDGDSSVVDWLKRMTARFERNQAVVSLSVPEDADTSINTVSGDITLDLVNSAAQIKSTSVSGDVTVRAPHRGYDVTANTASGQVVIDGHNIDKRSRPAGIRLTDGDGSLRLKANAVSGSVVVLKARPTGDDEAPAEAVR
jgi:hypothetical protein